MKPTDLRGVNEDIFKTTGDYFEKQKLNLNQQFTANNKGQAHSR